MWSLPVSTLTQFVIAGLPVLAKTEAAPAKSVWVTVVVGVILALGALGASLKTARRSHRD